MKKITILSLHLGYGGIENAVVTLANLLCNKYDVEILSVYRLYKEAVFKLDDRVKVNYISNIKPNKKEMIYFLKKKNFKMFFKGVKQSLKTGYVKYIKTALALKNLDTDVIISTRTIHNYLVSKFVNKKAKKIAWEHNHHNGNKKYINKLVKSCKKMDYLVNVSMELTNYYKTFIGNKSIHIPNCLDNIPNKSSKLDNKNIIAVGRLSREKGFDDLLKLFKKISIKNQDWKLNIVGDGMEKNSLLNLAKELKLGDKVIFHGYQNKEYINELLMNSSIYVMTSRTESFGLVLIEAMSYGLPCLSYTSAQGANEIITDGVDGYLIENRNEEEMISKISKIINDEKLRKKLGKNAKMKSKEYSGEAILEKWVKIINKREKRRSSMKLSIVVPCYNEGKLVNDFNAKLKEVLDNRKISYELIMIDDGSSDDTNDFLTSLAKDDKRVKVITFSRNFGKEAAMNAGLKYASGQYIAIMDADLQHDPQILLEMYDKLLAEPKYDVVCAYKQNRNDEGSIKRILTSVFYKINNRISEVKLLPGASDFRIFKRSVSDAIISLPEKNRFLKGIFSWVGFNTIYVPYMPQKRLYGSSKWSIFKLIKYSLGGIISFSTLPIKMIFIIGFFVFLVGLINFLLMGNLSHRTIILFLSFIMISLGIISLYLARIYKNSLNRPCYIIKDTLGFNEKAAK